MCPAAGVWAAQACTLTGNSIGERNGTAEGRQPSPGPGKRFSEATPGPEQAAGSLRGVLDVTNCVARVRTAHKGVAVSRSNNLDVWAPCLWQAHCGVFDLVEASWARGRARALLPHVIDLRDTHITSERRLSTCFADTAAAAW